MNFVGVEWERILKKSVYLFSNGLLKRKDNTLAFKTEDRTKYIPVEDVNELMVFGQVDLNKKLLEFLSQKEIILHYFNYYGYYMGTFYPREHYNSGYMILNQAEHYLQDEKRIILAKSFVRGSLRNMRQVLKYYLNRGKIIEEIIDQVEIYLRLIEDEDSISELMGIEGNARMAYYHAFDLILENPLFLFKKRTRRPPRNHLNSLISFGNSVLYITVLSEIYKTHLDPRIGYLHTTNFRRFTLNLDVAEIFKPFLVDRIIFKLIGKHMLNEKSFEKDLGGVLLNKKGRRIFIQEWDNRLQTTIMDNNLGRKVSYRRLIRMELYKLQKHFMEEKEYQPFVTRW